MSTLNELTIGELKELKGLFANENPIVNKNQNHSFTIGRNYFIQTATNYFAGTLTRITDTDLVLVDASWIADTGRLTEFLTTGIPSECEIFTNPVIISRGSLISSTEFCGELPKKQK